MRIGLTGSLALPSTGALHYHEYVFTRDEVCPAKWGRSRVVSLANAGVLRLGSLFVAYGPTLASVSDKINEFHLPSPYVLVILAQEPDAVEAAKAMAWTRSDQRARLVSVGEATAAEVYTTAEGIEFVDRSAEPGHAGYAAPGGLIPMNLPEKAAPAKPPAPKKKPKAEVVEAPIEAEPPSVPPEPETVPAE